MSQTSLYHSRRRMLGLRDPSAALFGTHVFAPGSSVAAAVLGAASSPITFSIEAYINAAGANGVLFEVGGSTNGAALALNAATSELWFVAGDSGGNDGVSLRFAGFPFAAAAVGRKFTLVASILPALGVANLWVNGRRVGSGKSVNGTVLDFLDTGAGGVGAIQGTINQRIPAAARATLTGATVGSLRIYQGQTPRGLQLVGLGTQNAGGEWVTS